MSANLKQYFHSFEQSQKLVDLLCVDEYPIDISEVFEKLTVGHSPILVSSFADYKRWAISRGINCPDEIKDAKCYYDEQTSVYIIVYNEKIGAKRTRFSLAHELGHIILGHLDDKRTEIDRGGLADIMYFRMEGEANTFAGNFLAPPILIHERIDKEAFNPNDIASFFQLSERSVKEYRSVDYTYWKEMQPSECEYRILSRCRDKMFPHFCYTCSSLSYGKNFIVCPICGEATITNYKSRRFTNMVYSGIQVNKQGRVTKCPVCENEEHIANSLFCMICSKPLINQCILATDSDYGYERCSHTEFLPGNARYCPYCGSKTTFFESGLLNAWDMISNDDNGELPF